MVLININLSYQINQYEPTTEYILDYGGAAYYPDEGQEMNVIGIYYLFNDDRAIINFNYGEVRVIIIDPHPEIEEDSKRDDVIFSDNLKDLGTDWNLILICMDWLMDLPISEPPEQMPPNVPEISGPKRCATRSEIEYMFKAIDPEGEELLYWVEWGDESFEEWIGPYMTDKEIKMSLTCSEIGIYSIKAKVKDKIDSESDWGTFKVDIPKNRIISNSKFKWIVDSFSYKYRIINHIIELILFSNLYVLSSNIEIL